MKLESKVFMVCVCMAIAAFLTIQTGYAYVGMTNLNQKTDGAGVSEKVDEAVQAAAAEEGKPTTPLSSMATLTQNLALLRDIGGDRSKVTLDRKLADIISGDVVDNLGYAMTVAALGGFEIGQTGSVGVPYSIQDSTNKPIIIAASEVMKDPAGFAKRVDNFTAEEFGVVLSIDPAEKVAVEGLKEFKDRNDKVTVVSLASNPLVDAILKAAARNGVLGTPLNDALESPEAAKARREKV
ncbi:MAG: hypothetical protein Q8O12_04610 [Candidatus Omnitrophota bacterium]|nr:hypothetical protein [Candidatus Omnitrophota bacterium]